MTTSRKMGRPLGSAGKATLDFIQRFDKLSKEHVDPLVLMFKVASGKDKEVGDWGKAHRITSTQTLLSYRYPKLKSIELTDNTEKQISISWMDGVGLDESGNDRSTDTISATIVPISTTQQ